MHPHLLHYRAALWSLNASRAALTNRAQQEAEQIHAEQAETADDGLRSTVYGARGGSGGHGDPAATTALHGVTRAPRPNRFQHLADSVTDTLTWLANQLSTPPAVDPILRLLHADPLPATAATVTRWLSENDQRIRDILYLAPRLWALPGAPECPACGLRALYVQTAAPSDLWTVVCRVGCVCSGVGCGCGMPVRVEGVPHIWDRSAAFVELALAGAVAGAAPTNPTN